MSGVKTEMTGTMLSWMQDRGADGIISGALVENNVIYNNGLGGGSGINCDGVQNSVIRNNLNGTFYMTREVGARAMIPQKWGRIVNVIAQIYRGFPGMAHTGAARAGVENLTMSLAVEWAQHGITVNAVAPGVIQSSGTTRYPAEVLELGRKATPLKRLGTETEVAESIGYLLSAAFVTGATLCIDGGARLWGDIWQIPD